MISEKEKCYPGKCMPFKKWISIIINLTFLLLIFACGVSEKGEVAVEEEKDDYKPEQVISSDVVPVNFNSIKGSWDLRYGDNYGYSFRLGNNYKAVVILYLNSSSLIFKGVYTLEEGDNLRINVSGMKREERVTGLNLTSGFVDVKSSYFIFHSRIFERSGRTIMELRPVQIFIDHNSSEGFFEPLVRLTREGG